MERKIRTIESQNLKKDVDVAVYGHFGSTLLMFSTQADNCFENEENGLISAIEPFIRSGKIRVYSVPTDNAENWLHPTKSPEQKSEKHYDFNNFVIEEALPLIYEDCGGVVPIITVGANLGAFHAVNTYFRRPDLFIGAIGMSGIYNLQEYACGYYDDNCYFNSPMHYLPNLEDHHWLSYLKSRKHLYLASGSGENERPDCTSDLANILSYKGIPHSVEIWGPEWAKNWETWKVMLPQIISARL